jgi:hypothetical protein
VNDYRPFGSLAASESKFVILRGGRADGIMTAVAKSAAMQVRQQGTYVATDRRENGIEVFSFFAPQERRLDQ